MQEDIKEKISQTVKATIANQDPQTRNKYLGNRRKGREAFFSDPVKVAAWKEKLSVAGKKQTPYFPSISERQARSQRMKGKPSNVGEFQKKQKGKTYVEIFGEERAKEISKKQSKPRSQAYKDHLSQVNKGKVFSDQHKAALRGPKSEKHKENMRLRMLREIESGKITMPSYFGIWREEVVTVKGGTLICRSKWETAYARYLDDNSFVQSFSHEKVRIPYFYEGKKHIYIVDFFVLYLDGTTELVEIKPAFFLDKEEIPTKFEAAKAWCISNNSNFVVVTEQHPVIEAIL
jgi:hypothetical protein